jgi:hypothetical protein
MPLSVKRIISAAADLQLEKRLQRILTQEEQKAFKCQKSSSCQVYTGQWLRETTIYDKPKMQTKGNHEVFSISQVQSFLLLLLLHDTNWGKREAELLRRILDKGSRAGRNGRDETRGFNGQVDEVPLAHG